MSSTTMDNENSASGNTVRLLILTALHFCVDFCGGLTIPMPEPTLVNHLGVSISVVAVIVGGSALLINIVQPLSGFLLPSRGMPVLLLIAPLAAACIAFTGVSHSIVVVVILFLVSAVGIGIIHPEAALAAHSLAGKRKGLGMSMFLSGGYFGFAFGSLVSGLWLELHEQRLTGFWIFAIPSVLVAVMVFSSGLHRFRGHMTDEKDETEGKMPFGLALALAVCLAANMCVLVRMIPIFLVRSFPDQNPQGWAGAFVFATGVTGALGSFAWGHFSDTIGRGKTIMIAEVACMPFLYMLFTVESPHMAAIWALGVGATTGAVFPLTVVLARQARGLSRRLRMGLAIGGSWGTGELLFILAGRYLGRFPGHQVGPVAQVLSVCWLLIGAAVVLAVFVARREQEISGVGGGRPGKGTDGTEPVPPGEQNHACLKRFLSGGMTSVSSGSQRKTMS